MMEEVAEQDRRRLASALRSALENALRGTSVDSNARHQADRPTVLRTKSQAIEPREMASGNAARPSKAISFSPELVRAIIDGRKTQTRRLIRPQPNTTAPSTRKCVIAQPHDLLAVREPWAQTEGRYVYAADAPFGVTRFRPAMYMPREASRLTLRVIKIEAQQLQQITREDALAEGCPHDHADPVAWFASLWDRIFTTPGERWADDPWVWVVHFERQAS